jgi:hypothetical protein
VWKRFSWSDIYYIHSLVADCHGWAKLCMFEAEAYYSQRAGSKNSTQSTKDKVCGFGWVVFHWNFDDNFLSWDNRH